MNIFKKVTTHDHCRIRIFKEQYYFIYLITKFYNVYIRSKIFNRDRLEKRMEVKRKEHYKKYPELYNGISK